MNLLENYLQPGYTIKTLPKDKTPVKDVDWVIFDGKVNCYGNIKHVHRLFTYDDWQEIKKHGYFMA